MSRNLVVTLIIFFFSHCSSLAANSCFSRAPKMISGAAAASFSKANEHVDVFPSDDVTVADMLYFPADNFDVFTAAIRKR